MQILLLPLSDNCVNKLFEMEKLNIIKYLLPIIISTVIISSCAQSYTPELKISCVIDFPHDNAEYEVKIQAGEYETLIKNKLKIYNIAIL